MHSELRLGIRVLAISREGFDKVKSSGRDAAPFVIRAEQNGRPVEFRASAVIDASGTWPTPNPLGANGLPAIGEQEKRDAIYYGIPGVLGRERARHAGRRTLVVGAGRSAANALLALASGTLPLVLFGTKGFGQRQGMLMVPARQAQASSPWLFGLCLDQWGAGALWASGALGLLAFGALFAMPKPSDKLAPSLSPVSPDSGAQTCAPATCR